MKDIRIMENRKDLRENPLLNSDNKYPFDTLPFNSITAADYEQGVKEGVRRNREEINAIADNIEDPTFENTIVALDRTGKLLTKSILALSNLESASGDPEMMDVLARVTPLLSELHTETMLNEKLWSRIRKCHEDSLADLSLSSEDRRLLKKTYEEFLLNGANLKGNDRNRLKEISSRLSDLSVRFGQNVSNEMKNPECRLWLRKEDLEGIPESIRRSYGNAAKEVIAAEGKVDDGSSYLVTLFAPSYRPFMQYSSRRDLRERLYRLYNSRNTKGKYDNREIIRETVNTRLELARLMCKKNYAENSLQDTMAETPENVISFLTDLRDVYKEPMRKELRELEEFAKQTEGAEFKLMPWDYSYWFDKLKNKKFSFSDEDMKLYFELTNTIDGVFGLATRLYGYRFVENNEVEKYHPDVRVYEVYDGDNKLLGLLYADFFYREGKSPGAWMTEFRGEYKNEDNERILPLISIVCNFSKPIGDEPVLLTPSEVETFLHEFGHALHGLSSEAKYCSLSGTNVKHDFVELFSQFNENFLMQKEYLDGFAKHYKTGDKIPQDLLDMFIKSSQFGAAYSCMGQLGFGFLDMKYHLIERPLEESFDVERFEANAVDSVKCFDHTPGCCVSTSFGHIFSGGYAAGYYGYKWSELLDADTFSAFLENGLFDKEYAGKFRKMLQAGDTADPMELYVEFRGKKPTVDALLRRDGIEREHTLRT